MERTALTWGLLLSNALVCLLNVQQVAIGPTGAIGLSAPGRVGLVSSLESESVFTLKEIASVWERRSNRDSVTATTVQ